MIMSAMDTIKGVWIGSTDMCGCIFLSFFFFLRAMSVHITYPVYIQYKPVQASYPPRPGWGISLHLHCVVTMVTIRKDHTRAICLLEEKKRHEEKEGNKNRFKYTCIMMATKKAADVKLKFWPKFLWKGNELKIKQVLKKSNLSINHH